MSVSNNNRPESQGKMWQSWAEKAQKGDKSAYNALLRDILPFIRNFLAGRVANPDWIDDIAQEVLLSVHKSLHTYSPDKAFRPWLMAITNFRLTDYLRKHYSSRQDKQTSMENPDFMRAHVTNPAYAGEYKDIEAALERVSEKNRKIFELMKIQGYTAREVANEMGMSVSAVKVAAHRTMNKLKDELG